MTDATVREPIALEDSLSELLSEHLETGRPVTRGLVGQLRRAQRRRWWIMDQVIVAEAQFGRFDVRVERLLDRLEIAGDRVAELIAELDAAGFNGRALHCAINQEREPVDVRELLLRKQTRELVGAAG